MNKCFIVENILRRKIFVNVSKNSDPDVGLRKLQGDTKKTGTFEMRSGSHVQLAALRNRDLELQTTSPSF